MIHAQKETAPRVPARARVCVCLYIHLLLFCLLICIHLHVLTLISIPPPKRAHTQQRQGNPISRIDMACLEGQSSDARLGELSPVAPVWVSVYVCSCWEGPERSTRCPSSASSLTILSLPFPSSPFFFFLFLFFCPFYQRRFRGTMATTGTLTQTAPCSPSATRRAACSSCAARATASPSSLTP